MREIEWRNGLHRSMWYSSRIIFALQELNPGIDAKILRKISTERLQKVFLIKDKDRTVETAIGGVQYIYTLNEELAKGVTRDTILHIFEQDKKARRKRAAGA